MPHVTFIHGISNKPPAEDLLRIWRDAIADTADPLPLGDLGVTSSLVYWADLLYERPEEDLSAYEGVLENCPEAIDSGGDAAPPVPRTPEEVVFLEGLSAKMTTLPDGEMDVVDQAAELREPQASLERVPLPWFLKRRFLNAYLRDVHHYLFDVEFTLPGRAPVRIQQAIRKRFVGALCASDITQPHIVVAHSLGTVIAYDCLKRVSGCAQIDGLITLGSPLGLDEVQDKLQPGWTREDGFPYENVVGRWVNIFDRLDPVCGFDPVLANDFRREGAGGVEDVPIQNDGTWRHSAMKYLRQPRFCSELWRMLREQGGRP